MKILPETYLWTRKNWSNFGSQPLLDLDAGIFRMMFQRCDRDTPFLTDISGKTARIFIDVTLYKGSSTVYWTPDPDRSTEFALAEICTPPCSC